MIRSFASRDTERFFHGGTVLAFQGFTRQARQKLNDLDEAASLTALSVRPGNHLESLSGNRRGQYSIRINRQWRICFRWLSDGPHDVEIVDYHR